MNLNPNVTGGEVELQSLGSGQAIEGPNGGPAMTVSGVDLGNGNMLIADLGNGTLTPLEPTHMVKRRDDLEVSSKVAPAAAAAPAASTGPPETPAATPAATPKGTAQGTPSVVTARRPGNK